MSTSLLIGVPSIDVYKRQVVGDRETEESEFADGHGDFHAAKVSEAVSYTHLDVYKRQVTQ